MTEIHLSDDQKAFIEEQVADGRYRNADEVVAAGLRLLGSEEGAIQELRRQIQMGIDDIDAGRVVTFDSAEEMTKHILTMAEERKNAAASGENVVRGTERSSRNV
ncbi:type II toxin-antitoxin system ParD family antitoxin [Rhizobium sp. S152]|uniref:type II toxin-antitoxin system ParD family antitoxin n=1 Tax=Rhizobium sp. S152 TaxID=3055038 RepID=UPI0025A9F81A|nr:type II toxin-antitoxin system ParD family antitoxin [Rhizobium sp. S152]MDM9629199.1 type II toxin-antitoxin system ParD family antitoxin [Rhizobium sp. S152]